MNDLARPTPPAPPALHDEPGHLIRRAQQIAVACFHAVHGRHVTPIQYAVLRALREEPGIDQVTLAQRIALDTSTTADIATRLDAKGWVERRLLPRRQRALYLTDAGDTVLDELLPAVTAHYDTMMGTLTEAEQKQFMGLLRKFVQLDERPDNA